MCNHRRNFNLNDVGADHEWRRLKGKCKYWWKTNLNCSCCLIRKSNLVHLFFYYYFIRLFWKKLLLWLFTYVDYNDNLRLCVSVPWLYMFSQNKECYSKMKCSYYMTLSYYWCMESTLKLTDWSFSFSNNIKNFERKSRIYWPVNY